MIIISIVIVTSTSLYILREVTHRAEQEYMKFIEHSKNKDLENPFIHNHNYKLDGGGDNICNGNVFLIVYILSERKNIKSRQTIRDTWASVKEYHGYNIRHVFLLGERADGLNPDIESESNTHRDIIKGNFVDSYENLTYKSVMGLYWVNKYCSNTKFVLKVDDDVIVNIQKLIKFLQEVFSDTLTYPGFLYCNVQGHGTAPIRRKSSKFYIKYTEYALNLYPPYCHGPGYVFSYAVASKLFQTTKRVPFLRFEDVFIGFCAKVAGIELRDNVFGFRIDVSKNPVKYFDWVVLKHFGFGRKERLQTWNYLQSISVQHSTMYYKYLKLLLIIIVLTIIFVVGVSTKYLYLCYYRKIFS